jgi:hypothetical protein
MLLAQCRSVHLQDPMKVRWQESDANGVKRIFPVTKRHYGLSSNSCRGFDAGCTAQGKKHVLLPTSLNRREKRHDDKRQAACNKGDFPCRLNGTAFLIGVATAVSRVHVQVHAPLRDIICQGRCSGRQQQYSNVSNRRHQNLTIMFGDYVL